MLLVALLVAPTLMVIATAAERRFGAAVAGWIGAAPSTIVLAVLVAGADLGRPAAAALAAGAAAHVSAQAAFAVAFGTVLRRRGGAIGLLCGTAAFAGVSLLVACIPALVAAGAGLCAVAVAPRLLPGAGGAAPGGHRGPGATTIRAAVAVVSVAVVLGTVRVAGPAAAGTIGAFPALSATLVLLILGGRGRHAASHALRGLVCGLPGYLGFCVTAAVVAPFAGVAVAVPVALGICLVVCGATWGAVGVPTGSAQRAAARA